VLGIFFYFFSGDVDNASLPNLTFRLVVVPLLS